MRLKQLHVENFRALEKMDIDFVPMTVIIGENDVGKTSCMLAVQALFERKKLENNNDYFKGLTEREVVIDTTFESTQPTEAQSEYVCGNKGRVRIRCTYPFNAPRNIHIRKNLPKNAAFRNINSQNAGELRDTLTQLKLIEPTDKSTKPALQELLRRHVANLDPCAWEEEWVEIKEPELAKLLPEFVLVPVGRPLDLTLKMTESSLLGKLFRPLLKTTLDQITETDGFGEIRKKLRDCVTTRVEELQQLLREQMNNSTVSLTHHVDFDPMKGLAFDFGMDDERATGIPIENRGAGVHNNLTLAMFRLLAQYGTENFILAIEEPENSLHPRGQREMLWALQGVAKRGQVICTTHSAVFLDLGMLEDNVVLTRGKAGNTFARRFQASIPADYQELRTLLGIRISDALLSGGGNCALIVEGPTELHAYPHFFTLLSHNARALGVSIISAGGSDSQKIKQHLTVLKVYGIPAVVVLDKDAQAAYDDLKGFGPGGELPNLRKVHLLREGAFETYIPIAIALAVINEKFPGDAITLDDIDLTKDRVKQFEKAIYEKKGPGARFEHFKVEFGQLVGCQMVAQCCELHAEIKSVIQTVKEIAEAV